MVQANRENLLMGLITSQLLIFRSSAKMVKNSKVILNIQKGQFKKALQIVNLKKFNLVSPG